MILTYKHNPNKKYSYIIELSDLDRFLNHPEKILRWSPLYRFECCSIYQKSILPWLTESIGKHQKTWLRTWHSCERIIGKSMIFNTKLHNIVSFRFKNEEDAVLFKLTWAGIIDEQNSYTHER